MTADYCLSSIVAAGSGGTETAADNRVKRVAAAWWCAIQAADISPITGFRKMSGDQA